MRCGVSLCLLLKGVYLGDYTGTTIGGIKGDTSGLDSSSDPKVIAGFLGSLGFRVRGPARGLGFVFQFQGVGVYEI